MEVIVFMSCSGIVLYISQHKVYKKDKSQQIRRYERRIFGKRPLFNQTVREKP